MPFMYDLTHALLGGVVPEFGLGDEALARLSEPIPSIVRFDTINKQMR
jgi:hypothetical protein